MEAAICIRCQSANPLFTKFCLTCGLKITDLMKRNLAQASTAASKEPPTPEPPAPPPKETSRWLRLLGRS
jgi:hypothetical protein